MTTLKWVKCKQKNLSFFPLNSQPILQHTDRGRPGRSGRRRRPCGSSGALTWSPWLVCLTRNLRKLNREHFRMRMRSEDPSPRWAAGESPWGLRGQAQDMLVALMARNCPQTTFHSSTSSEAGRSIADATLNPLSPSGAGGRPEMTGRGRLYKRTTRRLLRSTQRKPRPPLCPAATSREAELFLGPVPGTWDHDLEQGSPSLAHHPPDWVWPAS